MGFIDIEEREAKQLFAGIATRTFWGDKMLISRVELAAGAEVPLHSHPHEQVGIVLEGEITMTVGGESRTLGAGEMYIAAGELEHGGIAGPNGCIAAEIFSPVREEYKF